MQKSLEKEIEDVFKNKSHLKSFLNKYAQYISEGSR